MFSQRLKLETSFLVCLFYIKITDYILINTLHTFNFLSYLFRTSQPAADGKIVGSLLLVIYLPQLWSHDNLRSWSISRHMWNSFIVITAHGPWVHGHDLSNKNSYGPWAWSWDLAKRPFWTMIMIWANGGFGPWSGKWGQKSMGMISNCHEFTAVKKGGQMGKKKPALSKKNGRKKKGAWWGA